MDQEQRLHRMERARFETEIRLAMESMIPYDSDSIIHPGPYDPALLWGGMMLTIYDRIWKDIEPDPRRTVRRVA